MLRIIGGEFKNRALKVPKGDVVRPTLAVMRKAVFDMCAGEVVGCAFLDVFAGSGAMGIEALSRGAESAVFIERDRRVARCIEENLRAFGLEGRGRVIVGDAAKVVGRLGSFDMVYIDPPYGEDVEGLVREIGEVVKDGGIVLVEEGEPAQLRVEGLGLVYRDTRRFSKSVLHRFEKRSSLGL